MYISFSLYLVIWWAGVYEIKSKLAGDMGFLALTPSLAVFYRIFSVCNDVKCYIFLMHNSSTLFIGIVFLFYKTHELKNGTEMSATRNSRFWTLYRRMALKLLHLPSFDLWPTYLTFDPTKRLRSLMAIYHPSLILNSQCGAKLWTNFQTYT